MAKKIVVYPLGGTCANGFQCAHAVVEPKNEGDTVLCTKCCDEWEKGSEIIRATETHLNWAQRLLVRKKARNERPPLFNVMPEYKAR